MEPVLLWYQTLWTFLLIAYTEAQQSALLDIMNTMFGRYGDDPRVGEIKDHNRFDQDFDFIIVGAGSAGCVVANRLTEIEDWKVLLIEAGGDENFMTDIPILASFTSLTSMNWDYNTEPEERACKQLRNGVCPWPRGKVLGGSSVLNFLIYTRGHPDDYDDWAAMGNKGWSYKDVLPYFKKSENIGIKQLTNSTYHGVGGYLDIQHSPFYLPLQGAFKKAAQELGYKWNDPNGEEVIGFSVPQATMRNGRRLSSSKAFLEPIRKRKNLFVTKFSTVTKLLFDSRTKRAYGVEFVKRKKRFRARAKREVILSAGSIGSAQILMLSGIGPADHLEEVGIKPLVDLQVGQNLQDHVTMSGVNTYIVNDARACVNDIRAALPQSGIAFMNGEGPLTLPGGATGLTFFRTKYANNDTSSTRPDMEIVMGAGSLAGDTIGMLRSLLGVTDRWAEKMFSSMSIAERQSSFSISPVLVRPRSKGYMKLRSSKYSDKPIFIPNYFHEIEDLYALREGAKMVETIIATSGFRKFNATMYGRPAPGCEHYKFKSDEYWECAIMQTSITLDHQVGTCKMGPSGDKTAVVSPRLLVYGVRNLRIADCSIMPRIPAGHTNAPAIMIGEKAADLIKEDWGVIKKSS